ncbi:hypothetical protein, partial [Halorubrum persicum]|uniref:hypothetical protein n=1 Tax=Halorubrum persicum TaxID=1383844 RepID=UPI001C557C96
MAATDIQTVSLPAADGTHHPKPVSVNGISLSLDALTADNPPIQTPPVAEPLDIHPADRIAERWIPRFIGPSL